MPNINDVIVVDKVMKNLELPDLNAVGPAGDAVRSAYTVGSKVYNTVDNYIYTVIEDQDGYSWSKSDKILTPGSLIRVKSFDNNLYQVTEDGISLSSASKSIDEDDSSTGDKKKEESKSITFSYLKKYLPRTLEVINQDKILSSFELLLPIIVDDPLHFFGNDVKHNAAPEIIKIKTWLEENNFIEYGEHGEVLSTDKPITSVDIRNFATMVCRDIYSMKTLSQGNIDFKFINPFFFDRKNEVLDEKSNKNVDMSVTQVLSNLRNDGHLYSSSKDIAIRNVLNGSFREKNGNPKAVKVNNKVTLVSDLFSKFLTQYYKKIINFDVLKSEIQKEQSISDTEKEKLNSGLNSLEIYDHLENISESLDAGSNLKTKLDYIISNCNPLSLIFLLIDVQSEIRNIMNTDPTLYKQNKFYSKDGKLSKIRNVLFLQIRPLIKGFNKVLKKFDVNLKFNPFEYLENPEYSAIGNSKGHQFEIPKNINPIDPTMPAYFRKPQYLDIDSVKSDLKTLDDRQLNSASANIYNPRVDEELIKYFSSIIFIDSLAKSYGIPLSPEDYNFDTVLKKINEKGNPTVKSQYMTVFPIFSNLKLYFNELYNVLKPELKNLKETLNDAITGKNYSDTQENTESLLGDVKSLFQTLDDYMKQNNYDIFSLNRDSLVEVVKSNLSLAKQFYTQPITLGYAQIAISDLSKKIEDFLPALDLALNDNTKEGLDKDISQIDTKANVVLNDIKKAITDEIELRRTQNDIITDEDDNENIKELIGSIYSNFSKLLRRAAKVFTVEDFNLLLTRLKTSDNIKNTVDEDLYKDSISLYNTATTIINLFGLTTKSDYPDINKVLEEIVSNSDKFSALYSRIIDINVVNNSIGVLRSLIMKLLRSQNTYDYNTIKNEIINSKNNIYLITDITDDDNSITGDFKELDKKYIEVFKDVGITTFNQLNKQDNVKAILEKIPDINTTALWIYIANKLYYLYYNLNKGDEYLKNYLSHNKFKLVIDVADSLTKTGNGISTAILKTSKANMEKLQYFYDASQVANKLDRDKYYANLPDSVKHAYANNEVLEAIETRLYKYVTTDPNLNLLIQNSGNITFNDYITGNMLTNCKVYDMDGDLMTFNPNTQSFENSEKKKSKDLRSLLEETRTNSIKIEESEYAGGSSDVFTKLFNKLKGLNAYGITRNSVVALGVIKELGRRKDYFTGVVSHMKGKILNDLQNRLNSINKKFPEEFKDFGTKLIDKMNTYADQYNLSTSNLDKSFEQLKTSADEQINQNIKSLIDFIMYWKSNNKDVAPYIDITMLSDKERKNPYSEGKDKVFPIHIELNSKLVNKSWASYLDDKLTQGDEVNKLRDKLDAFYDMIMQNLHNSISSPKCSVSNALALKDLAKNTQLLKNSFNNNIVATLLNKNASSVNEKSITEVPSPEYVTSKINQLEKFIDLKIASMVSNSIENEKIIDSCMKECSILDEEYKKLVSLLEIVTDIDNGSKDIESVDLYLR